MVSTIFFRFSDKSRYFQASQLVISKLRYCTDNLRTDNREQTVYIYIYIYIYIK
jgi:hypothetical protein